MRHLRRTALVLAHNNYTPVDYWLSLPLAELHEWIEINNRLVEEQKRK